MGESQQEQVTGITHIQLVAQVGMGDPGEEVTGRTRGRRV
jgi:hypothetical protein